MRPKPKNADSTTDSRRETLKNDRAKGSWGVPEGFWGLTDELAKERLATAVGLFDMGDVKLRRKGSMAMSLSADGCTLLIEWSRVNGGKCHVKVELTQLSCREQKGRGRRVYRDRRAVIRFLALPQAPRPWVPHAALAGASSNVRRSIRSRRGCSLPLRSETQTLLLRSLRNDELRYKSMPQDFGIPFCQLFHSQPKICDCDNNSKTRFRSNQPIRLACCR